MLYYFLTGIFLVSPQFKDVGAPAMTITPPEDLTHFTILGCFGIVVGGKLLRRLTACSFRHRSSKDTQKNTWKQVSKRCMNVITTKENVSLMTVVS